MKYLVHTIDIDTRWQKVNFQIELPRNTKAIHAINITAIDPHVNMLLSMNEIGHTWLKMASSRDLFYTDILIPVKPIPELIPAPVRTLGINLQIPGWQTSQMDLPASGFVPIHINGEATLIEGYYEDVSGTPNPYKVTVYFKIELI